MPSPIVLSGTAVVTPAVDPVLALMTSAASGIPVVYPWDLVQEVLSRRALTGTPLMMPALVPVASARSAALSAIPAVYLYLVQVMKRLAMEQTTPTTVLHQAGQATRDAQTPAAGAVPLPPPSPPPRLRYFPAVRLRRSCSDHERRHRRRPVPEPDRVLLPIPRLCLALGPAESGDLPPQRIGCRLVPYPARGYGPMRSSYVDQLLPVPWSRWRRQEFGRSGVIALCTACKTSDPAPPVPRGSQRRGRGTNRSIARTAKWNGHGGGGATTVETEATDERGDAGRQREEEAEQAEEGEQENCFQSLHISGFAAD